MFSERDDLSLVCSAYVLFPDTRLILDVRFGFKLRVVAARLAFMFYKMCCSVLIWGREVLSVSVAAEIARGCEG